MSALPNLGEDLNFKSNKQNVLVSYFPLYLDIIMNMLTKKKKKGKQGKTIT